MTSIPQIGSYLKPRTIARCLGLESTRSVWALVRSNGIPFIQLNDRTFVVEERAFIGWLEKKRATRARRFQEKLRGEFLLLLDGLSVSQRRAFVARYDRQMAPFRANRYRDTTGAPVSPYGIACALLRTSKRQRRARAA